MMEKDKIETRPTESMMASSGLDWPAHARWTIGQPGSVAPKFHGVGWLNCHEPLSGCERRKRRSIDLPSLDVEAMVPCLDHAMPLFHRTNH